METRINKYNRQQLSPDRAKVWTERSPKYHQNRRVPVVYYLCRNRQLEHPHFIEVPISSPDGLYLRDVIEKLNVLRGRGMASMYSWSSKRSYKSGFVWHDLSEDDLILPAHGNEYVLKGSELFEDSNPDHSALVATLKTQNLKQLPEPSSSRSQEDSSSSSSMYGKEAKHSQEEDELSPPAQLACSSSLSPESGAGKNSSWNGSLGLTEYKVYKSDRIVHTSTQTDEDATIAKTRETCTRGVSTDDGTLERECKDAKSQKQSPLHVKEYSYQMRTSTTTSSASNSSGGRTETLESLIRADANKINSFRILEEGDVRMSANPRLKATNVLMQLISCGSVSVKDHSFGHIPTYKPRFSHSKYGSPLFPNSVLLGELDCLSDHRRLMSMRLEDKEYFSGSLIESKLANGDAKLSTLKRSSSYDADRNSKPTLNPSEEDNDESTSSTVRSKCIPLPMKVSLSKHSIRSPTSDRPRNSSDGCHSTNSSQHGSKRLTNHVSLTKSPNHKLDSFREDNDNVIQIEERLASGARVIIHSQTTPCTS
ncbi:Protein SOSEKI 3 [Linum perenne]